MNDTIRPGDGGELHLVVIDYKVLLTGNRTDTRHWYGDTFAADAAKALAHAVGVWQQELSGQAEVMKVWDVRASVELAGDVLRQKLERMNQ